MSRSFTIIFILLASFIFLNMFVGVMIMHTEVRLCHVYALCVCMRTRATQVRRGR